jgi:DNA mismatch repair protein MutS2
VVVTGPNTGGKTVALKTVGLLALMAQCGLHLPAEEGTRLTVFEQIWADIGDEQSIEQSLSTFSSHMTHIIEMLEAADERSLVLLDELGAGTDPLEGAALAQALLIELLGRQITVLATTHYAEIKVFAEQQPGIVNASVEFDVQTLAPTYHLTVGLPGQSNAFAIANGLGLPPQIVARARELVSADHLEAENFLVQIKQTQAETAQAREAAQQANATAQKASAELRERLAQIEQERVQTLNEARERAAQELAAVRKELGALRRQMAIMGGDRGAGPGTDPTASEVEAALDDLDERLAPVERARATPAELDVPGEGRRTIEVGDTVWVPALDATGEVLALEGEAAEVQMGAFRVRTRRAPLQLRNKGPAPAAADPEPRVTAPYAPPVRSELHLRGLRVDEALPRLEKYVDDAYRAQAPFVRIVHGKGTGTLRKMVHQFLRDHPFVSSFRLGEQGEGGTGVTVVKFEGS